MNTSLYQLSCRDEDETKISYPLGLGIDIRKKII